jgi:hypothetical protein
VTDNPVLTLDSSLFENNIKMHYNYNRSITGKLTISILAGCFFWLVLIFMPRLNSTSHFFVVEMTIPFIIGIIIRCFGNSSKWYHVLLHSFIAIFVSHVLLSVRAFILISPELDLAYFVWTSVNGFLYIGSVQIFFCIAGSFLGEKLIRRTNL